MRKSFTLATVSLSLAALAACNSATPPVSPPPNPPTAMSSSSVSPTWTWDGKTLLTGTHQAVIKTSMGDITVELDAKSAPKTVTNFMALASQGYYNGVTFHRVIPGFMIQGGDPSGNGTGGKSVYGETFEDEINPNSVLYKSGYKAGVIAMANRGPNTNGSQFFIMDADYPLPANYTIFGHVTEGQQVVNAIARVARGPNDMPTQKVTFSVKIVK